ncbi:MAG: hypothetical protein ACRERC_02425, partial [Candidatus Binatia bacterium]
MKSIRIALVALGLCSALALWFPTSAPAEGVLSGELVVLEGAKHRFRLIGHEGSYTAPAGTPLDELDGKNVQIELGSGGRVTQITEAPVRVEPVVSGVSTVRGQLLVQDGERGTFTFAGDTQTYTAAPGFDIRPYNNQWVQIELDSSNRVSDVDLVSAPAVAPPAAEPIAAPVAANPAPARALRTCPVGDATVA